jgi:uncharacterized damage-inducible protein DinB
MQEDNPMPNKKSVPKKRKSTPRASQRSKNPAARDFSRADKALREHVLYLLKQGGAHVTFDDAIADLPAELGSQKLPNAPHTVWELVEHMRIAQWDILEFSRNPKHVSPEWPSGYWPPTGVTPDQKAWEASVEAFRSDLQAMEKLAADPATDLFAKIPHGDGQTILREALLVADHNSYHLGQIVQLRRLLGAWPGN